jgi:hypothetical protein
MESSRLKSFENGRSGAAGGQEREPPRHRALSDFQDRMGGRFA